MINARNKGKRFEYEVRDLINLLWGLTGSKRCERMPMSGAASGLKGDLRNTPKPIDKWIVECKNHAKFSKQIIKWWKQAKEEAEQMAGEPVLVCRLPDGDILCMRRLKEELKDQLKLRRDKL